jgi:hypothetical protein
MDWHYTDKVIGYISKNGRVPPSAPSPATLCVDDLSHFVGEVHSLIC